MKRIVVLSAGLIAAWALSTALPSTQDPSPMPGPETLEHTSLHTLTWTSQTTTVLPGAGVVEAGLSVEGVLAITDLGEVSLWELRDLKTAALLVGGEVAPIEGLDRSVVRVPAHGQPTIHGATTEAARHVLTALYSMAEPHRGASRLTPYGTAEHQWTGSVRSTTGYRDLRADPRGLASLSVSGTGTWTSDAWVLDETVTAERGGDVVFSATDHLERRRVGTGRPVTLPLQVSAPVSEDPMGTRAEGLTGPQLLAGLRAFDGGGGQETAELMWRGTARLALEPGLTAEVAALASDPQTSLPRRELALDLLAHARSGAAQAALRLALEALQDHADYPMYLARLAFVEEPDGETVAFASQQMAMAGSTGLAAMHVAGSLAWRAELAGNGEVADVLVGQLEEVVAGGDDAQRAAALSGLGNARQPESLPVLVDAADGSPSDQRAAAHALRHWRGESVDAVLLSLTEGDSSVQRAALSSLEGRSLDGAALGQLAAVDLDGANLQLATSVLAPHADVPQARSALQAMLGHDGSDPRLRARIRSVLSPL